MDWKKVASKVVDFAPILGTFLGGPLGAAGGGLIKVLANELGLKSDEEVTPDAILNAINVNPEAALKLREFELTHKVELQKLVIEQECVELERDKAFLEDRQSARDREVNVTRATGARDYNLYVLAWTVILLFYALVAVLCFQIVPDANLGPVNQLFGAMAAGFGMVLSYFFGSSRGSAQKSQAMEEMVKNGKK